MKKIMLFTMLILLLTCQAWATGSVIEMPTQSGLHVITSEWLPVLTTGVTRFTGLSTTNKDKFFEAHVYNTAGATVIFRVDGSDPTATGKGNSLANGSGVVVKDIRSWDAFRAITASGSGSGSSLFVTIYGR